ncbi:Probable inactive receptor kinase At5g67200 [Linum perenne]
MLSAAAVLLLLLLSPATAAPQPDAVSLLSFKSTADLDNNLHFSLTERFDYCQWQGVTCFHGRILRLQLQNRGLRGGFAPNTLSRLDQLRTLILSNNSLSGPIPDLSPLINLKSLILDRNSFSGTFPPSILLLHRLTVLDLSHNGLAGPVPNRLARLDRLGSLRLEWNRFTGVVPPLNQSFLVSFNVSGNNLTGRIPLTPTLSRFGATAFLLNPDLCGEIVEKECSSTRRPPPFFEPSSTSAAPLSQSAEARNGAAAAGEGVTPPPPMKKRRRVTAVLAFTVVASLLALAGMCLFLVQSKRRRSESDSETKPPPIELPVTAQPVVKSQSQSSTATVEPRMEPRSFQAAAAAAGGGQRSGNLVFCGVGRENQNQFQFQNQNQNQNQNQDEQQQGYNLEQLMRASAELLGRGSVGTTYKAVLDNQLIMTVKRLDAGKTAITGSEAFEKHMEVVGGLRHPNLVRIRAYFQAKGERLVIYDYQPNGSLFNLIHGSRSTRAKPLHWTSCLKIAEDVAHGLAYIHKASPLIHGNLKSSNVLLGPDFEACITDYCLASLANQDHHPHYSAPETRNSSTRRPTAKSDVYSFGVLLLELLSGKHPSQHPYLDPSDLLEWVRVTREENGDREEDEQMGMLTEVASVCSLSSPEQRPAMWQVVKMLQEIKDSVVVEDSVSIGYV